jgi:hypothetical protein
MPTTTIETIAVDQRFARQVAKELSFWWRSQGADINHVITRFVELPGDRVFSGPFPLRGRAGAAGDEDLAGAADPAAGMFPFAFVDCVVSRDRDARFRRRYAQAVRDALNPWVPESRIFVSFRSVDPSDYFTPGAESWAEPSRETS